MLTPVTAPPIAIHSTAAAPANPSRTTTTPQPQKVAAPQPKPQESQPRDDGNSYGEDAKPVTFEGLLHRAIGRDEEPAPVPIARNVKSPIPDPKPAVKSRAIGTVFPVDVQEKTDPLPLVASIALPLASPTPLPSSRPDTNDPASTLQERGATAPTPDEAKQLAPAGSEAFTVHLNPGAPVKPETTKQGTLVTDQARILAAPAAPVSLAPETTATAPIASPTPAVDLKPVLAHAPISVTSIESIESPAPVTTPTTPVRDLALHLPGANGVEVRMTERSGEVRVEVRTGDQEFTQDLRDNLHELVSGLERKGFSAEVSHPAEQLFARAGEASSSNDSPSDGRGGASADDHAREQAQQQQRQPDQKFDGRSPKARAAEWSETFNFNLEKRNQ